MKKIVVIDDDPQIRAMLKSMLGSYEVIDTDSSDEVFVLCANSDIELVITDLFMPGKSGVDLIEEVKVKFPTIKILAISGGSQNRKCDFLPLAGVVGANDTLQKPFSLNVLREKVENLI